LSTLTAIKKLNLLSYIFRTRSKIILFLGIIKNFYILPKKSDHEAVKSFSRFTDSKNIDPNWKNNTKRFLAWSSTFISKFKKTEYLKILEIGSCQGHSALFFLWFFENSKIECVDVWDRFTKIDSIDNGIRDEELFDQNLNEFEGRCTKHKLFSLEFFTKKIAQRGVYDIIYIDGSHHSEEVLSDCLHSFALLKLNGLLIIDDVFLMSNKEFNDNSLKAIDLFLDLKKKDLKVLRVNSQLFIEKKSDNRLDSKKFLNE